MVVDWGPGKWSLRIRSYVQQGEFEIQQYESLLWVDPAGSAIKSITFGQDELAVEGGGTIKDGVLTLEQPKLRSIYRPDVHDEDKYDGEILFKTKGLWNLAAKPRPERKPLKPLKTHAAIPLAINHGALKPLARFVGGEWSYALKETPNATIGYHTQKWSLHGSIQIGHGFNIERVPESLSCMWTDPKTKTVRSISISDRGTITRSAVTFTDKGSVWNSIDTVRGSPSSKSRVEIVWNGKNGYRMLMGEAAEVIGKRVQPKK